MSNDRPKGKVPELKMVLHYNQRSAMAIQVMMQEFQNAIREERIQHKRTAFETCDNLPALSWPQHYIKRLHDARDRLESALPIWRWLIARLDKEPQHARAARAIFGFVQDEVENEMNYADMEIYDMECTIAVLKLQWTMTAPAAILNEGASYNFDMPVIGSVMDPFRNHVRTHTRPDRYEEES